MALMDESVWRGKIFSGGWVGGDLGTGLDASVIEPATGQEIGRTGIATPADVARAAQIAAAAQPAWAATPHTERSAILRRAEPLCTDSTTGVPASSQCAEGVSLPRDVSIP